MFRFKCITLSLVMIMLAFSVKAQNSGAKIVFEENIHDFGDIVETDGPKTNLFEFKNTGKSPLIINSVNSSCGCTTPKWTKKPIAPGGKGSIEVTYNPKNRPGAFNKTITIISNADIPETIIRIKGYVSEKPKTIEEDYPREIGSVRAKTNFIRLGIISNTEKKTASLEIINPSNTPVTLKFKTPPPHMSIAVEPEIIQAKGKANITVTYDGTKSEEFGQTVGRIYLLVNGNADYKNSIGVVAELVEDLSALTPLKQSEAPIVGLSEQSYNFGKMKQGEKKEHTFSMTNKGKSNLIIREISSSCGCTIVTPDKKVIGVGETIPIKITFDSEGKIGSQAKTVKIVTNAPNNQNINFRILADIQPN